MPKIIVLVKYTPDLTADRSFLADGTVDRAGAPGRLSELDEHAAEQALQVQESSPGWELTYLTMGPDGAQEALRKALSMGGDAAVHVKDDALHGSDAFATSLVLAAAITRLGFDLVLTGMASTDAGMGVVPALLAERLGVPQVTFAGRLSVSGDTVEILRDSDTSTETVTAAMPAVVSVTDRTGEARYPSFKGIMAAKKKPVQTWSLADLSIDPAQVGLAGARTTVLTATRRPARTAGQMVKDDGDGGRVLADFLAAQRFI
ncbi:MAG TPA: electron transfer flavoprotein subunit beta/FixA family protein [Streptosporangiaceae bacterium]|nr:electron transfer flavoprotein subunit beta/FixA family protein [Streptosporangiaceae bacterium]